MANARIEHEPAEKARVLINRMIEKAHRIITLSGTPAIGGYIQNVDVILDIFNLFNFHIDPKIVYDMIDRAIGVYENDKIKSLIRTFNPLFWFSLLIKYIISIPFSIIGLLGFNQEKIEMSFWGQFIKGLLYIISLIASILTILQIFDLLNPMKDFLKILF